MRIDRYILDQLAGPCVFFLTALTGIVWVTQSLRSVDLIVNRGLSVAHFFSLTLLVLPSLLSVIMPIALFAGILYAFGRLALERELVVMWGTGLSPLRLARPAVYLALGVTLVGYLLSLYLMPLGNRSFHSMRSSLQATLSYVLLQEGAFNSIGDTLTVYIRERMSGGELRGILVHDRREPGSPVTMMAARGALLADEGGPRLVLVEGNRQVVDRVAGSLSLLYFDRYTLDLSQYLPEGSGRWREPSERYLHELFRPGDSADDRQHRVRLISEGHQRLLTPLYNLAFALVALAAMQVGEVQRRGQGWRIAGAISAVLLFRVSGLGIDNLAGRDLTLLPLLYLHMAAAIGAPLYLLAGAPGRRRRATADEAAA